MAEWPQERRHRLSNPAAIHQRLADIPAPLIHEVEATGAFAALVQAMVGGLNEGTDPATEIARLSTEVDRPHAFGDYDETVRQAVLGLAGVAALRKVPTSDMWEYLWSLAWHSAPLATFLPQAVVAAAEAATFREQFLDLAPSVIEAAIKDPGRRAIQREKEIGANLREHWQRHPQLSALWRGNFEHSFHAVDRDDDHILSIVADIDTSAFVRLLTLYDYPDPVAHALTWCGAGWRFERWCALASVAPAAFDENARMMRTSFDLMRAAPFAGAPKFQCLDMEDVMRAAASGSQQARPRPCAGAVIPGSGRNDGELGGGRGLGRIDEVDSKNQLIANSRLLFEEGGIVSWLDVGRGVGVPRAVRD